MRYLNIEEEQIRLVWMMDCYCTGCSVVVKVAGEISVLSRTISSLYSTCYLSACTHEYCYYKLHCKL